MTMRNGLMIITYHRHNVDLITVRHAQRCLFLLDAIDGGWVEGLNKPGCLSVYCVLQRLVDNLDCSDVREVVAAVDILDNPFKECIRPLRVGVGFIECRVGCVLMK